MDHSKSRSFQSWATTLGGLLVVACFCLPLFRGLDQRDLQNDEAIYAYAVDRMVDGAGWMTPRSSPTDGAFLEKPPLKFWMVAAPIEAGLLPHDEMGMRFFDVVLGSVAFLYVYLLGVRLAGPVCGAVAVLVLFTFEPLLSEHGLRSNNMEAALFLCHAGGLYHFARWVEGAGRPRVHALAMSACFVLGFMTKFVAAAFLPLIAIAAVICDRPARARVAAAWRDWLAPVAVAALAILPWFLYQSLRSGGAVWSVMLGQHVYTRFTASLDPQHLESWNFYFVETWTHLRASEAAWIVIAGAITLSVAASRHRGWLPKLVLAWAVLPFVLLSLGTSKLYHYAYAFLPPLGLAAGHAAALWIRGVAGAGSRLRDRAPRWQASPRSPLVAALKAAAALVAVAALLLAAWTTIRGRVELAWNDLTLFRSSSVERPLTIAAIGFFISTRAHAFLATLALLPLAPLLPLEAYHATLARTGTGAAPLRAIRDCGLSLRASHQVGEGFYNASSREVYHSYFYYLRRLGSWQSSIHPDPAEMRARLYTAGHQTPVVLSQDDFDTWLHSRRRTPPAIAVGDGIVVVLPGAYEACVQPAVRAGARRAGSGPGRAS